MSKCPICNNVREETDQVICPICTWDFLNIDSNASEELNDYILKKKNLYSERFSKINSTIKMVILLESKIAKVKENNEVVQKEIIVIRKEIKDLEYDINTKLPNDTVLMNQKDYDELQKYNNSMLDDLSKEYANLKNQYINTDDYKAIKTKCKNCYFKLKGDKNNLKEAKRTLYSSSFENKIIDKILHKFDNDLD